jgi:predicted alpha/beta-fold hydrolase
MPKICPLPVKFFTGRKDIFDKMHQYFDTSSDTQHVFVLHGLGGSGKSQLAFKFLDDAQRNQWYGFYQMYDKYELWLNVL